MSMTVARFLRLLTSTSFWAIGIGSLLIALLDIDMPDSYILVLMAWMYPIPFIWVVLDAHIRGKTVSAWDLTGVALLFFVFVPVYIIKTRPPNINLLSFAKFIGLSIASYLTVGYLYQWLT